MNPKGNPPNMPLLPNGKRDVDHSWSIKDTWKQLEDVVRKGKVKYIGLSNCSEVKTEEILSVATILPVVDQLELHPYNPQHRLLAYLKEKGIVPQAYSPLGSTNSPLVSDEVVQEIAKKHGINPSDVLLGYHSTFFFFSLISTSWSVRN
jgi:glycerol 2-dehydrogenase (NADP+)